MKSISFFAYKIVIFACLFACSNIFSMEKPTLTSDEKTVLRDKLQTAFDSSDIATFKAVLEETSKSKYAELINSPVFGPQKSEYLLHLAVKKQKLDMIKTLVEAKADINVRNAQNQTPEDLALLLWDPTSLFLFSYIEIFYYLFSQAHPNLASDLCIFIDHSQERNAPNAAISTFLKKAIQEQATPCLIFGKHLFDNVKNLLSPQWIIFDFFYKGLEIVLLIPKVYLQEWLGKDADISKLEPKEILNDLGFSWDQDFDEITKGLNFYCYKFFKQKAEPNVHNLEQKQFSALIPQFVKKLLTDTYPKCIYIAGHGSSIGSEKIYGEVLGKGLIANLFIKDALDLFSILAKDKTQLVYVNTCFLGGINLNAVQEMLNSNVQRSIKIMLEQTPMKVRYFAYEEKAPSNMIFISGATAQTMTAQLPTSFKWFFNEFKIYLSEKQKLIELLESEQLKDIREKIKKLPKELKSKKSLEELKNTPIFVMIRKLEKQIGSLKAVRRYFASISRGFIDVFNQNLNAFPQIRFPTRDAQFYSLAPAVIDDITLGLARAVPPIKKLKSKEVPLVFSNEPILVIDVPYVDMKITMEGTLPLLILAGTRESIAINQIEVLTPDCDIVKFMQKSIIGSSGSIDPFFAGSPHEDIIFIKELILPKEANVTVAGKSFNLDKNIFNIFVSRKGIGNDNKFGLFIKIYFTSNNQDYVYEFKKYKNNDKYETEENLFETPPTPIEDTLGDTATPNEKLIRKSFFTAAQLRYLDIVKELLRQNVYVINIKNKEGQTLLHVAVGNNFSVDSIKKLLDLGADINAKDNDGATALDYAVAHVHEDTVNTDIVKLLILKKANVNVRDSTGFTPLHYVRDQEIVKILVDAGANINALSYETKETPLNHIMQIPAHEDLTLNQNRTDIVKTLLAAGADTTIPDINGKTPLDIAKEKGYKEIEALLSKTLKEKK